MSKFLKLRSRATSVSNVAAGKVNERLAFAPRHDHYGPHEHGSKKLFHEEKDASVWLKPAVHSSNMQLGKFGVRITTGLSSTLQVRWNHSDLRAPHDFNSYMRKSFADPTRPTIDSEASRRVANYAMMAVGASVSLYYAKAVVWEVAGLRFLTQEMKLGGATEVKLADVPEGATKTYKWRGKPVFVRHRTQEEIEKEKNCSLGDLRDPQHDHERCQKPEWLIVVGICTHLGCVPIANKGDWGGWYCPCHGSHYDASGRIRKGPAPLNLEVPDYKFIDDGTVVVGAS